MNRFHWRLERLVLLVAAGLWAGLPTWVEAADPEPPGMAAEESAPLLPLVEVIGTPFDRETGRSTLNAAELAELPQGNGSINELLRLLPAVQFSDQARSSRTAGEIQPPALSISGGKVYQNNFRIDGVGNNSLLDPTFDKPGSSDNVPGHPQEIFLDSDLIESVTVYDSNVPARFGGFTGGVVEVTTRDPAETFGGSVRLRTTRDSWTHFHISEAEQEKFEGSTRESRESRFRKYLGGLGFDLPLGPKTGLLVAYDGTYAQIPLFLFGELQDQSRRNDNLLLKLVHKPSADTTIRLEAIYNPYRSRYFIEQTKDSGYSVEGGGTALNGSYLLQQGEGHVELTGSWRASENARSAPDDFFSWAQTPSRNWGESFVSTSREGGFGDLRRTQRTLELNADWLSAVLTTGVIRQQLNAGLGGESVRAKFSRTTDTYSYATPKTSATVICAGDDPACADGEQWLSRRNLYPRGSASADINQLHLYLEDRLGFGRLAVRAGGRLSYDDLMAETNLAPRLAGSYDLQGDGGTVLSGGWNRYDGQTLLTYKLREGILPLGTETRELVGETPGAWISKPSATITGTRFSKLKTPYADEWVVGIDQTVLGGRAGLKYVRRRGRDEFARVFDPFVAGEPRYYRLTNNGRSHYESYRATWEGRSDWQSLAVNACYEKTRTNNVNYDDLVAPEDLDRQVWFDRKLLYLDELPAKDFNRSGVVNLTYGADLPEGFHFTNVATYRSGYRSLEKSKQTLTLSETVYPIYEKVKRPSAVLFDWRIDWQSPAVKGQSLQLTLEVNNVFNRRVYLDSSSDSFELGRQFWAGATYRF